MVYFKKMINKYLLKNICTYICGDSITNRKFTIVDGGHLTLKNKIMKKIVLTIAAAAFLFTANASNEVVVSQNVIEMNAADEWDDILNEYEAYVNKYIACIKKVKAGDMSAMADLATLMEKAEKISAKLEKAEDEMSTTQAARYAKITAKLADAAKNL